MNLQEELKSLKERITELEELAKEEQEFPQVGDEYWFITDRGMVFDSKFENKKSDKDSLEIGNIFQTKEQAEFAAEKLRVEAELRKFSKPFEYKRFNHYIFLDTDSDCLGVDSLSCFQSQGTIYFESRAKARQAIESIGEERIKKYIFGVED